MGGLFKAPQPIASTAPTELPVDTTPPEEAAGAARVANADRARRGLAGTIATSARGVLDAAPSATLGTRRSLLGE
ncbi:hypothetical protein C8P66_102125 [Humitalea rosea]|uniref:Uncharacterized protein n=1 Tax=Humitalea rosea TaxID=990373 RepID=A0A2W7IVY6_9PROT|nr:hypothetical protein [Humitalea rosea]PZW50437.1 hypothetical protein C8P66_102125 [Humitalea rosea]